MGNCLSSQGADDLSLLNESEGASLPGEPPPPYQVQIGLIQHLPKGIFDPGSEPSDKKVKE
nr:PREDICTED: RING finger protein 11-like [Lepisosteus oculatus]